MLGRKLRIPIANRVGVGLHLGDYILTYFKKYDIRGKWRFMAQQKAET